MKLSKLCFRLAQIVPHPFFQRQSRQQVRSQLCFAWCYTVQKGASSGCCTKCRCTEDGRYSRSLELFLLRPAYEFCCGARGQRPRRHFGRGSPAGIEQQCKQCRHLSVRFDSGFDQPERARWFAECCTSAEREPSWLRLWECQSSGEDSASDRNAHDAATSYCPDTL